MFPFGFGAKKDRGTGFSVLAAREMKQEPKSSNRAATLSPPFTTAKHFSISSLAGAFDSQKFGIIAGHETITGI